MAITNRIHDLEMMTCLIVDDDKFSRTFIIMITVDTKEKTVLDAKNLGIREYLVKPISPIALKKRICNVFGIKERV